MKSYSEQISAGQPCKLTIGGKLLYVQRSGAGALDISFYLGQSKQTVSGVSKGFKAMPVGGFDQIEIKSAADGVVDFIVTDGEVNAQFDDASTIIGNDDAQPLPIRMPAGQRLPVDLANGTVNVNATNVAINNDDAHPVPVRKPINRTIVDYATIAINTGAAQALVSDVDLLGLRIRNTHATALIAIGSAAVTMANAATIIQPGEVWSEDDAPGAAWYATSDTDGVNVCMQGVKA